jgi:hypothetical protein
MSKTIEPPAKVRRVILGQDPNADKSFVMADELVDSSVFPGVGQLFTLWAHDQVIDLGNTEATPGFNGTFPPVGGTRVYLTRFSPKKSDLQDSQGNPIDDMPSANDVHRSETCDVNIVLYGAIDCIMSDGAPLRLNAGDMIILNGADHAWSNAHDEESAMLFFIYGARAR